MQPDHSNGICALFTLVSGQGTVWVPLSKFVDLITSGSTVGPLSRDDVVAFQGEIAQIGEHCGRRG